MSVVMHHTSVQNPGIQVSEAALQHFIAYLKKNPEHKGVSLSVKKTGCSGFSYVIDYVENASLEDIAIPLSEDYFICIAKNSYPLLQNICIDYVKQGLNYKLVFNNPNQTGQCGCGESFTVD
jgi:iron-sulfur cluster assembly protein